ncbi:hypothetical protein IAQ61_009230 [Plenodomus lingam]|uniref:uncharacterized protein n=1 Tax=Leptosphaeria maculans TaxID=5022 RepID=UPI00332249E5|nr:hypothetical protein IAQ61_009230 [Plenodomus lingam]
MENSSPNINKSFFLSTCSHANNRVRYEQEGDYRVQFDKHAIFKSRCHRPASVHSGPEALWSLLAHFVSPPEALALTDGTDVEELAGLASMSTQVFQKSKSATEHTDMGRQDRRAASQFLKERSSYGAHE